VSVFCANLSNHSVDRTSNKFGGNLGKDSDEKATGIAIYRVFAFFSICKAFSALCLMHPSNFRGTSKHWRSCNMVYKESTLQEQ
jgi:hypothetical protein